MRSRLPLTVGGPGSVGRGGAAATGAEGPAPERPRASGESGAVRVRKAGAFVTFDDALVTQADIGATNGVVHLIDKVILPAA